MGQANQYQFQNYEPTLEAFNDSVITYADMAEIILEKAIFSFKKEKLMREIDSALANLNKEQFIQLSNNYNKLLKKYSFLKDYE